MGAELTERMRKLMESTDRKALGKRGLTNEEHDVKAIAKLERHEHRLVLQWCKINGVECGHARMDIKSSYTVGWPDFSIPYMNQTLYGEMKIGLNKLSKDQERIVREFGNTGTYIQIWDDGAQAIRAIRTWLEGLGWQIK